MKWQGDAQSMLLARANQNQLNISKFATTKPSKQAKWASSPLAITTWFYVVLFIIWPPVSHAEDAEADLNSCQSTFKEELWHESIQACMTYIQSNPTQDNTLHALNLISLSYRNLGDTVNEKAYFDRITAHPLYADFSANQHKVHRERAIMFMNERNLESAEIELNITLDTAVQLARIEWIARANNDFGLLYRRKGNYEEALAHYHKALKIELQLERDLYVAIILQNIGGVLLHMERHAEAAGYFEQSMEQFVSYQQHSQPEEKGYVKSNIIHAFENMVESYVALGQTDQAALYHQKIMTSFAQEKTNQEKTGGFLTAAKYYINQDKPELAYQLLQQIPETKSQQNSPYHLEVIWNLAHVQQLLAMNTEATENAHRGLSEAQAIDDAYYLSKFNLTLSRLLATDQPHQAITYLEAYQQKRELFLQKKHDTKIDAIEYKIKKAHTDNKLLEAKLINSEKEKHLAKFRNWVLGLSSLLFIVLTVLAHYVTRKRKEQLRYIESINHHKQQLLLLQANKATEMKNNHVVNKKLLQKALVKTMVNAVDVWFRYTGKNKIDLADQSKSWKVTNDDGNLRTRSLDKYLHMDQIPQNPRWRNVIKTCHFILAQEEIDKHDRQLLESNIKTVMGLLKRH